MTTDAQILATLRGSNVGVSASELSQKLGVGRSNVRACIEQLRSLGYDIESSPHNGYRLVGAPDVLHADDLVARLGNTKIIGRDIRVFQETTSTNDIAEKLARDGVREGVVVFAESQTRGRGRLGRRWVSPPRKGLWFSVLLRPRLSPQAATQLTIASATALVRAVRRQTGLLPEIKWPNDLLIRGRKIAGVLTEMNAELDAVRHLVLGIGVDVNVGPEDLPGDLRRTTTSLRIETGGSVDRAELAAEILRQLDHDYGRVSGGKFEALADEWEERCETIGRRVVIHAGDRRVEGRAESLDADGALLLRTQHGHLERIIGGDVTVEK